MSRKMSNFEKKFKPMGSNFLNFLFLIEKNIFYLFFKFNTSINCKIK